MPILTLLIYRQGKNCPATPCSKAFFIDIEADDIPLEQVRNAMEKFAREMEYLYDPETIALTAIVTDDTDIQIFNFDIKDIMKPPSWSCWGISRS